MDVAISSDFPGVSIAGLPIKGKITMKNTGSQELTPQVLSLFSETLLPQTQTIQATSIPPFGSQTWEVSFEPTSFLTKADAGFTIQFAPESILGDKTAQKTLKIAPFFMTPWGIGGIASGILAFILFILALKIRRVRSVK
jgi:hypothetical protein